MSPRRRIPRTHLRARRGFTLVEMMVIVVIIGIVAVIAVGSMSRARNERLMFDYARKISGIILRGQSRSFGRNSPHLVVLDAGVGARGRAMLFEGTDGVAPPTDAPAPDGDNACRVHDWTWTYSGWAPGATDPAWGNEPIEGLELAAPTSTDIKAIEDITATYLVNNIPAAAVVICYTRSGVPLVGYGGSVNAAITDPITGMQVARPFTGAIEVNVVRHSSGTPVGQGRKVIVASGSAPRIRACDGFTVGCP